MSSSIPIGASVLLQNLQKSSHLNDKKCIVKSSLHASTGRQEVYIFDQEKTMAVKPSNLRYEPRELSSLSVAEMKGILNVVLKKDEKEWVGMDKEELRCFVKHAIEEEDPIEIAKLVAKANEPKEVPSPTYTMNDINVGSLNSSQLKQGAERMSSMIPDDLRRQAATMRAMGPAAMRNMNPQMARMSGKWVCFVIYAMSFLYFGA